MDKKWTLRELAAEAGIPERTIRFYISRGLVAPPLKAGRGAAYDARHLDRVREIRTLQAKGMPLAEIARLGTGPGGGAAVEPAFPAPSPWLNYSVSDDVMILVRAALGEFAARIAQSRNISAKEDKNE